MEARAPFPHGVPVLVPVRPRLQKRATLTACLKKVHAMASDAGMLKASALDKVAEFGSWRMEIQIRV